MFSIFVEVISDGPDKIGDDHTVYSFDHILVYIDEFHRCKQSQFTLQLSLLDKYVVDWAACFQNYKPKNNLWRVSNVMKWNTDLDTCINKKYIAEILRWTVNYKPSFSLVTQS